MRGRLIAATLVLVVAIGGVWEAKKIFLSRSTPPAMPPHQEPIPPEIPAPLPSVPARPQAPPKTSKRTAPPKKPSAPAHPSTPVTNRPALPVNPTVVMPPPPPLEWKGNSDTSITHSGLIVVKNDNQWNRFWAEHHPHEPSPDVDFSHSMVVGVFLGQRPADGFTVEITGMRILPDAARVDYIERAPPPGTFQVAVTAFPYDIKVVPRSELPVKFNKLTAQYEREGPAKSSK